MALTNMLTLALFLDTCVLLPELLAFVYTVLILYNDSIGILDLRVQC